MSSTRVAINRIVITGRAVTDPITKTVNTHHGESTLTTFAIRTAKDTYVGSVIMDIQTWARTAGQAGHVRKGRIVAVDGQLTQHEYIGADGRRHPHRDPRRPPPTPRRPRRPRRGRLTRYVVSCC